MKTRAIPLLMLLASLSGCDKAEWDDCLTSTGEVRMDERAIAPFTHIDISDNVDLVITPDTVDRLVLEAGDGLLEQIVTEVIDGATLRIRNNNTCNWVRRFDVPIVVHLRCRDLRAITYRGTGDISATGTLTTPSFILQQWGAAGTVRLDLNTAYCEVKLHTGTGDAILSGATDDLVLYAGSYGLLDAGALLAHACYLSHAGSNDMIVRADGELGAILTQSGDVYYAGDPVIAWSEISGSGQLIKVD